MAQAVKYSDPKSEEAPDCLEFRTARYSSADLRLQSAEPELPLCFECEMHSSGRPEQQSRKPKPSLVGQHAPTSPISAQAGFALHDSSIGAPQHVNVIFSAVGLKNK